jgi:hypothetical protein
MKVSKLDFMALVVCVIGPMFLIEQGHRIHIGLPTDGEMATSRAHAATCSDTDAVPYSVNCLVFLDYEVVAVPARRRSPAAAVPVDPISVPN